MKYAELNRHDENDNTYTYYLYITSTDNQRIHCVNREGKTSLIEKRLCAQIDERGTL